MINTYVSIDLETTGLNPKVHKITEIGAVKVVNGVVTETFETFINPRRKLESRVVELTGITDEDLKDAPFIEEQIEQILQFIGDMPILGHSVLFDYSFLKRAAVNRNLTFEKEGIDTLKIARKYLPDLESRNLGFLCEHYGIEHKAHRALEDAMATSKLYQKLAEEFFEEESFSPKPLVYKVKKEGPITKHQKEWLLELIERHNLEVDYDVDGLTKNEASRYTDLILAKYGR